MRLAKPLCFFLVLITFSCSNKNRFHVDLDELNTQVDFIYFYDDFYNPNIDLLALKKKHSILFPPQVKDSITNIFRQDSINLASYKKTKELFGSQTKEVENKITNLFKRLTHHYPDLNQFKVYFSVGFFEDYTQPVLFNPQTGDLFVSLDLFLGKEYPIYDALRIPLYYQNNMNPDDLYAAIAVEIAEQLVRVDPKKQKFIHQIINNGKHLLFVDALLPNLPEEKKIGYTKAQWQWCKDNEPNIWNYFVENQHLFSNSYQLNNHFIQPAPFSKFGTETEQDSPGRVGVWVGWQMIRQYWENNSNMTLPELAQETDEEKVLKESKYKPL